MLERFKIIAIFNNEALPNDCIDINVHVKNVSQGFIDNNTERLINDIYQRLANSAPAYGKPTEIVWGGSTSVDVMLEIIWR